MGYSAPARFGFLLGIPDASYFPLDVWRHLARHVRRMRRIYVARREVLLDGLRAELGRWFEPVPAAAGLHLKALAKGPLDVAALVESGRQQDVTVYSVDRFRIGRARNSGLVFVMVRWNPMA